MCNQRSGQRNSKIGLILCFRESNRRRPKGAEIIELIAVSTYVTLWRGGVGVEACEKATTAIDIFFSTVKTLKAEVVTQ